VSARPNVEFTIYRSGDKVRLRLEDEAGHKMMWDMSAAQADVLGRALRKTSATPRETVGRHLFRIWRQRRTPGIARGEG